MDTFQVTRKILPCIKIHQTSIIHDPRRRHPSSNSKMVGCHSFSILSTFLNKQELSSIKIFQNTAYFLLPPDTHPKFSTEKDNYEALSRSIRVHIFKDNTISSSKAPKSHVKLIIYINNDNGFNLIIDVVFTTLTQLGVLGPKAQDPVISFRLGEEKRFYNSNSELFRYEVKFYCYKIKKNKSTTSQVNKWWKCKNWNISDDKRLPLNYIIEIFNLCHKDNNYPIYQPPQLKKYLKS